MINQKRVFVLDMRQVVRIIREFEPAHPGTDPCVVLELMIKQACLGDLSPWSPDEICASTLLDNYPGMDNYWINRVVFEMKLELDHMLTQDQQKRREMTMAMTRGFGQERGCYYAPE